jgi:hypothetical protein
VPRGQSGELAKTDSESGGGESGGGLIRCEADHQCACHFQFRDQTSARLYVFEAKRAPLVEINPLAYAAAICNLRSDRWDCVSFPHRRNQSKIGRSWGWDCAYLWWGPCLRYPRE